MFVCLVAGTLTGVAEGFEVIYSSALERFHSHMRCVDLYYKKLKTAASNTLNQMCTSVHNKLRSKSQRRAHTVEEFERSIDRIVEEARRNAEKELELRQEAL